MSINGDSLRIAFQNEIRANSALATDRRACKREYNAIQSWLHNINILALCGIERRLPARASAAANG